MAKTGYVVFVLEMTPKNKPKDLRQVAAFGGPEGDLLRVIARRVRALSGQVERLDRFENALRIERWDGRSRWLSLDANFGPYGASGFLIDVDGVNADGTFGDRQARAIEYRAMFVVPAEGTTALLFCERRSATTLKGPIEQLILKHAGTELGGVCRLSAHTDPEAWERFLTRGNAYEVSEVWRSTRQEDYSPETGRHGRLKVSLEGQTAVNRGRAIIADMRRKLSGVPDSSIQVSLPEVEVADGFQAESATIKIEDGNDKRTVVIANDDLPQWVYMMDNRPDSPTLFRTWQEHAQSILSVRGTTLQDDWAAGPDWPAGFTG